MSQIVQPILVPVIDSIPEGAINYANMLSDAYQKPILLLNINKALASDLEKMDYEVFALYDRLIEAIRSAVERFDPIMVVFERKRSVFKTWNQLSACRDLRIPYWFVPLEYEIKKPSRIALPVSFLVEDREKATWGRSFSRYFDSSFKVLKPRDKGNRAGENVIYIADFFDKNNISYDIIQSKKSSYKINKDALSALSQEVEVVVITASREYGLDDYILGPKELHLIRKTSLPLMLVNPRADLYILCGD